MNVIQKCSWHVWWLGSAVMALLFASTGHGAQIPPVPAMDLDEIVLFPFDDQSIPFTHGLRLRLLAGEKQGVVLPLGGKNAPDSDMVEFYGSLIRIDGQFRMWYIGRNFSTDDFEHGPFRICYAVSDDGIHWQRPALGLVEFLGNRNNNLVGLHAEGGKMAPMRAQSVLVLHEPDDPNPKRRFKLVIEREGPYPPNAQTKVFFSPDGLRWTASAKNPVITHNMEPSGLIKYNGCYYLNGHNVNFWDFGRVLATYISDDFENWTEASKLGFKRTFPKTLVYTGDDRQQVHMGASLWNRGNVIIGFYGSWQYPDYSGQNKLELHMPLGMVVSNDALNYREPVPDFEIIPAKGEEDGSWPALQQAQAFENIRDKTYVWYSCWDEYGWANQDPSNNGGLVRLATWDRDRLGCFYYHFWEGHTKDTAPAGTSTAHFVTRSLIIEPGERVFVNAEGLSVDGYLTVELLDERLQPLEGFSGPAAARVHTSGLRQPVTWRGESILNGFDQPVRFRVSYEGPKDKDILFYAMYVSKR